MRLLNLVFVMVEQSIEKSVCVGGGGGWGGGKGRGFSSPPMHGPCNKEFANVI